MRSSPVIDVGDGGIDPVMHLLVRREVELQAALVEPVLFPGGVLEATVFWVWCEFRRPSQDATDLCRERKPVGEYLVRLPQRLPGEHAESLEEIFAAQADHRVGTKDVLGCLCPNLFAPLFIHLYLRSSFFAPLFAQHCLVLLCCCHSRSPYCSPVPIQTR